MKKALLALFILFDIGVIIGTVYVLITFFKARQTAPGAPSATAVPAAPAVAPAVTASTATPRGLGAGLIAPPAPGETGIRKILFSYRNPKAKLVEIRAEFTGWKGESMIKGANGVWTYQAQLAPGEYAYCFTVDDKTFKDPANKRTKLIGRTTVSAIVVEAKPATAVK